MRRLVRLLRRSWAALHPKSRVRIRALHADDLAQLFGDGQRELGRAWLARQERGELHVAVAELGGVPAGRRCLDLTSHRRQGAAYCFAFYVRMELRSRGIGTLIDRGSEAVARARGFHALQSAVAKGNPRGLAWHQRLGYRIIDEQELRWLEPDGEHQSDCWVVERRWGDHPS